MLGGMNGTVEQDALVLVVEDRDEVRALIERALVNALLRRAALRAGEAVIRVGDLSVDTIAREVTRGDRQISLTQKEYALLEYLARNAGRPVTREQIAEQVWKTELDPKTNIVDVYV